MVKFPLVSKLAARLAAVKAKVMTMPNDAKGDSPWIEVWLRVDEEGGWKLIRGEPPELDDDGAFYAQDHVGKKSDLNAVAANLIEEVKDFAYIAGVL